MCGLRSQPVAFAQGLSHQLAFEILDGRLERKVGRQQAVLEFQLRDGRRRGRVLRAVGLGYHFLRQEAQKLGRRQMHLSSAAIAAMAAYQWPGNVRELKNRIQRALGTTTSQKIEPEDLGLVDGPFKPKAQKLPALRQARKAAEIKAIRQALAYTENNISQAAKHLKISRPTLHDLMKKYGIAT